jgi:hypothetical protein
MYYLICTILSVSRSTTLNRSHPLTTDKTQAGRPNIYDRRMSTYTVTLDRASADKLKSLGNGNLSAGTRRAAELYNGGSTGQSN